VEKFYYRGSSLDFSFLDHAYDINYEVDVCVDGYGMDRIIIVGDCLLVMVGGAKFSGMGRKDIGRMKVKLSVCFNKHLPRRNMGELTRLAVRSLGCRWRRKPTLTAQLFLPPLPAKYQS
jgi:hypothetical protein